MWILQSADLRYSLSFGRSLELTKNKIWGHIKEETVTNRGQHGPSKNKSANTWIFSTWFRLVGGVSYDSSYRKSKNVSQNQEQLGI